MDEKSLYAHILSLSDPLAGKVPFSMKMPVLLLSLLRSLKTPASLRPAVNPVLFTITVIVNGAILIPASSPLW